MGVEDVLKTLATDRTPRAFALRGRWGVGKSYLWHNVVKPAVTAGEEHSYVSLFGLDSVEAMRAAAAVTAISVSAPAVAGHTTTTSATSNWSAMKGLVRLLARVGESIDTPYLNVSRIAMGVALSQLKGRLVCIDDVERRGSHLRLEDVLGFVHHLVEDRACRVLVILNDEAIGDLSLWELQREKVFRRELVFAPDSEQATKIGLKALDGTPYRDDLADFITLLDITNIRLVQRCAEHVLEAHSALKEERLTPHTRLAVTRSAALYAYSTYGRGVGAPTIDFLRHHNTLPSTKDEDPVTAATHTRWAEQLNRINHFFRDELDDSLVDFAHKGYLDREAFREAVLRYDGAEVRNQAKEAHYGAWRAFHDNVLGDTTALLASLLTTWPRVSTFEGVHNLEGVVELLRVLGEDERANRLIDQWVAERAGDRIEELDDQNLYLIRAPKDDYLIKAIELARENEIRPPSIARSFAIIADRKMPTNDALEMLVEVKAEDYVDYWIANDNAETLTAVREIVRTTSSHPSHKRIRQRVMDAASIIAAKSPMAAHKMKAWFGIGPEGVAPVPDERAN